VKGPAGRANLALIAPGVVGTKRARHLPTVAGATRTKDLGRPLPAQIGEDVTSHTISPLGWQGSGLQRYKHW
jgi:hypothetical protein